LTLRVPTFPVSAMNLRPFYLLLVSLVLSAALARADLAGDLSPSQLAQVKAGQMVVLTKDIPGGVWPQITIYTTVNAPVSTISAVFRDYAHAQDFQPSIVSAKVIAQPSPNVYDVAYVQKMPLFGTTSFTVRNTFTESKDGTTVDWKLLKSSMADISDGSLRVEPFGTGSIMRYTNYVKPKFALAGMAKGAALDSVKTTVSELKAEAEKRAKK
jgi:hypothetical protein